MQREALPTGSDDSRRDTRDPEFGCHPQIFQLGIAAAADSMPDEPTSVLVDDAVAYCLGDGGPIASHEVLPHTRVGSARRIFEPRRLRVQFVEPGERGVYVCLVEDLDAAVEVAFDYEH